MRGECAECGGPVRVEIDTDGRGMAVDRVWPCPRCRPIRSHVRGPDTFRSGTISTCPDCGGIEKRENPRHRIVRRCFTCRKKYRREYSREYYRKHKRRWAVGGRYNERRDADRDRDSTDPHTA